MLTAPPLPHAQKNMPVTHIRAHMHIYSSAQVCPSELSKILRKHYETLITVLAQALYYSKSFILLGRPDVKPNIYILYTVTSLAYLCINKN